MNLYELDTPAVIVDLDRLERNIARMARVASDRGKALRPHIKTHKCPEIARMQQAAGAIGLTVAKLGEAEVFADAGFDDLFMANQLVGAPKIERLIALLRRVRITVGVDSIACAEPLSAAGVKSGLRVPVRMEVDTGTGRAGVRGIDQAIDLGRRLAAMPGLEMDGLFTYEGGIMKSPPAERTSAGASVAAALAAIAETLARDGIDCRARSVGSTPAAQIMAQQEGITELRPGTYVFYDSMQTSLCATPDDCAVSVLTTVISRPDETTAILDAGTKSFSGDKGIDGSKHGLVMDDPAAVFDWANEEHGHLDLSAATIRPRVGDKLRIVPWHVCTCVNMHDTLHAVRGDQVEAAWPVAARGRIR